MRFQDLLVQKKLLVGARRFELLTPCAQGRCATRLRYAPTRTIIKDFHQMNIWLMKAFNSVYSPFTFETAAAMDS